MISDKYKCVFIHIPKTAGMSVEKMLCKSYRRFHQTKPWNIKHGGPMSRHYKKYFNGNNDYFKFTIVRNPWDRAVSLFYYEKMMVKFNPNARRKKAKKYFNKYGDEGFSEFITSKGIGWKDVKNSGSLWRRQAPFLWGDYDYICRFENLEKDMKKVCKQLNIPFSEFPWVNKGDRDTDYRKYYKEESKEIISNLYKEDIDILGYEF